MSRKLDAFAPFSARLRSLVHGVTHSYNESLFFAPKLREPQGQHRMRCTSCGTANCEGAKFCDACGTPLPLACPACGTANRLGAKFCNECGAALAGQQSVSPPAQE